MFSPHSVVSLTLESGQLARRDVSLPLSCEKPEEVEIKGRLLQGIFEA